MKLCRWKCGKPTSNISGICSDCWKAAAPLRSRTDEGYSAWLENYRARQAAKKPLTERQRAALAKARAAKFTGHFRFIDVSSGGTVVH